MNWFYCLVLLEISLSMRYTFSLFLLVLSNFIYAQEFKVLPLGIYGGGDESNLSSYLIADYASSDFVACDAGTLRAGLNKAYELGTIAIPAMGFLQEHVKAYLISHSHFDHVAGLIINSPEDSSKNIYASQSTLDAFQNYLFTNTTWSNFGSVGEEPILGKYTYKNLSLNQQKAVEHTDFVVSRYALNHPVPSDAFLIQKPNAQSILYLGDTGADSVENSQNLKHLWKSVAELVMDKSLKAILIEVSFPNAQDKNRLFGHLTPELLNEEMQVLAQYASPELLKEVAIVITHIKPDADHIHTIKSELESNNPLGLHYVFPEQGVLLSF